MSAPDQFTGFMINSADKWSTFTKEKVCLDSMLFNFTI